jgi:hypothetical protein
MNYIDAHKSKNKKRRHLRCLISFLTLPVIPFPFAEFPTKTKNTFTLRRIAHDIFKGGKL